MTRASPSFSLVLLLAACQSGGDATRGVQRAAPPASNTGAAPSAAPGTQATAPSRTATAREGAQAALDALDARTPVPLLPMMADHQKRNMRDHLLAVQEIATAAARDDFDGVERAARRIGFSEQMGAMCEHMGAGAPGFTALALEFHHTADGIVEAARQKDATRVLKALGDTLAVCTHCHRTFKQRVVDPAAWAELTAATGGPTASH